MSRLVELAHGLVRQFVSEGDVVIDATAGAGRDTLFLAQQVGPTGHVHTFDIQAQALSQTRQRLMGYLKNLVTLHQANHQELLERLPVEHHQAIAAVMFNLGYLPQGDPAIKTTSASTLNALQQSVELLRPGGVLSVIAYTGHPGGLEEAERVAEFFAQLVSPDWDRLDDPTQGLIAPRPRLFAAARSE